MSGHMLRRRSNPLTPAAAPSVLPVPATPAPPQLAAVPASETQVLRESAPEETPDRGESLGHDFSRISVFAPGPAAAPGPPSDPPRNPFHAHVLRHTLGIAGGQPEPPAAPGLSPLLVSRAARQTEPEDVASTVHEVLRSPGQALDAGARAFMEPRFGHDFSQVQIHTDARASESAEQVAARAYAVGGDIVFRSGEYNPGSSQGRRLLAHELTHVVQQGGAGPAAAQAQRTPEPVPGNEVRISSDGAQQGASAGNKRIQRDPDDKTPSGDKTPAVQYYQYQVLVPNDYTTLEQMYRLFERTVYGREMNLKWSCNGYCDMAKNRGKVIPFKIPRDDVESNTDPALKKQKEKSKEDYGNLAGKNKQDITNEVNRRYSNASGDKPGTKIGKGDEGKARMWDQALNEVMQEKQSLESLPPDIKALLGPEGSYQPKDYQRLLKIAEKLKQFTPEDFTVYKLLTVRATTDLDLFEKSVDMFLARKAELAKALAGQQQGAANKQPTLKDSLDEKWKDLDESSIGKMSEDERYKLARQKTSELTSAQLKYMKDHPGETLKDFAKSATLVNTPETLGAIGKDLQEMANSDANSWARWAAGTGAGAKLSGWLLAVAGVLYVASWLTGIGELATIAAAAGYLLAATITLSAVESELRIKAASQAKTPEEFKRNVELAAAARANVVVGVALIVVAAVLHFTAKALFPETMQKINTSIKNFRERVRLKGSISDLKPKIRTEMGLRKAELSKVTESAKAKAVASAEELNKLSTEQFAEKMETGDGGFLDPSKQPAGERVNFRELLKTPEGRAAIEGYKAKLVNALRTDVVQAIDRLAKEYGSKIDEFLSDVEAAKNHDDLNAALDKIGEALSEEHAKTFMAGEQEKITKQKLEEAAGEAQKEALAAVKEGIVKRIGERIAKQADKFKLTYTEAELDAILKKGKELGLDNRTIEDMIYTGSRTAKAISAAELMQQMENWGNVIKPRGYPYKFADLAEFQAFSKDLVDGLRGAGIPVDDVRVQGSALRKPGADDVDLAAFVDQAAFDKLLVDRYNERMALKDGTKITLKGKSHAELAKLAGDIEATPGNYNSQASTFMNAMKTGIINSKSDIIPALKKARATLAGKYPSLNIQTISVLIRGGLFEVKPDLPVKGN